MLDVKKLIMGFLILAFGASTTAWILSSVSANSSGAVSGSQNPAATQPLDNNAFTNTTSSIPEDVADLLSGELPSSTETALDDPNNLTAALGNSLLDGLVSANPNGIETDDSGNGQINQPDDQAVLAELFGSQSMQNVSVPNWDTEVLEDQANIRSSPTSSDQSMADYLNAFTDINNKYFVQSGLQQIADAASTTSDSDIAADPSVMATANAEIPHALADAMRLTVPAPFVAFQKSWIRVLIYEKNTAELLNAAPTDPARTTLALALEQNNYTAAVDDFEATLQKTLQEENFSLGESATEKNALTAFLDNIFAIEVANAQGVNAQGVFVPVSCPTCVAATHAAAQATGLKAWLIYLKKYALDIALQILKNTLIAQLQSHVMKWIQNSGAPMFVQNWADDFANAAIMSATNYINSNFACIGTANLPRVQLILNAIYKPGNNACAAQFQSQLSQGNLTNFLNNFQNGGFVTFGQTLMPSNDFYGGLFFTAQGAAQTAQQSQSLFSVKTTAQQGFKGVDTCADGSNPNGTRTSCRSNSGDNTTAQANSDGTCPSGYTATTIPNGGFCANGAPPTTQSPGQTTGMMLNQALGAPPKLIAGATTIDGIINAFTISLINSLASTLVQTASGAINGALNSVANVSTAQLDASASSTATSTISTALSCNPPNQSVNPGTDALITSNDGGTWDASGNPPNYTWTADPDGHAGATFQEQGDSFDSVYNIPGTYNVTLSDDTGDPSTACSITVTTSTLP